MSLEDVWRHKNDEQLVAASRALDEYNEAGRNAILNELRRRTDEGALSDLSIAAFNERTSPSSEALDAQSGLIIRLWRGHVSLPRTFWMAGLLTQLSLRALMVLALSIRPRALLTSVELVMAVMYVALLGFISVAIWRSAGRYQGPPSWRNLARLWVALTPVQLLLNGLG